MSDEFYNTQIEPDEKSAVIVVYVLYLLMIPTLAITHIIGVIIAHAKLGDAGPGARSHYIFLIRTFWWSLLAIPLGLILLLVGGVLSLVLIGIPIFIAAVLILGGHQIWYYVRVIVGLIRAVEGRGYANPRTLLV